MYVCICVGIYIYIYVYAFIYLRDLRDYHDAYRDCYRYFVVSFIVLSLLLLLRTIMIIIIILTINIITINLALLLLTYATEPFGGLGVGLVTHHHLVVGTLLRLRFIVCSCRCLVVCLFVICIYFKYTFDIHYFRLLVGIHYSLFSLLRLRRKPSSCV